ncbi:hypothetical protein H4Q26_008029 [Puccinia striiformis f. sp. tritici PST-130]|nr:hypothetical protein H4Q26_008029 [Puccinia striiformis f. sp. tritici PST-130]
MTSSSAPTRASSSSSGAAGYSLRNRTSVIPDYDIDLRGPSTDTANLSLILRGYLSAGLMAFTSAAMVMPFEVGKTLLQVQWIPAQALHDPSIHIHPPSQDPSTEDYLEEEEDEEDDDILGYLFYATNDLRRVYESDDWKEAGGRRSMAGMVLPVVIERGVSDMMRAISRWRGEGFLGLWKGQLTAFIIDTISSKLQPILLSGLFLLGSTPSAATLPLEHQAYPGLPLALSVGSYTITGLLLAPLDLIRTRLIVQSSQLRHRKYSGPINAFQQIVKDEGGIRNLFLDSTLLFPALLDNLVRPLIHLATPLIIDRVIGIDRVQEPLRFGLAEFGISSLGLLLVLPLETVRKRLQLQSVIHLLNCSKLASDFVQCPTMESSRDSIGSSPRKNTGFGDCLEASTSVLPLISSSLFSHLSALIIIILVHDVMANHAHLSILLSTAQTSANASLHTAQQISIASRLSSRVTSRTHSLVFIEQYQPIFINYRFRPTTKSDNHGSRFQTTSLFAVLLVIAMTQGLSVLSSPLTGPTPPGPPRKGKPGPTVHKAISDHTTLSSFRLHSHAPSETISRQSTASRNLIRPIVLILVLFVTAGPRGYVIADPRAATKAPNPRRDMLSLTPTLPLETVRKRLQLQSRHSTSDHQQLKYCVRLRPVPYNGIVEGFYRITTEEKHGFWGLVRGLNVGITANFVVFILSLIGSNNYSSSVSPISSTSISAGNGGWAEV